MHAQQLHVSLCMCSQQHCPALLLRAQQPPRYYLEEAHQLTFVVSCSVLCCAACVCTGSRAWAGMTHDAILEAVRGPWQLAVPPGLPPVLQELLQAALSKNPQERWGRRTDGSISMSGDC